MEGQLREGDEDKFISRDEDPSRRKVRLREREDELTANIKAAGHDGMSCINSNSVA